MCQNRIYCIKTLYRTFFTEIFDVINRVEIYVRKIVKIITIYHAHIVIALNKLASTPRVGALEHNSEHPHELRR